MYTLFGRRLNASSEVFIESSPANAALEHDQRLSLSVALGSSDIRLKVIIYRGALTKLRPLVIVNSVDFPMPPSNAFCDQMWSAGFQIVYIERPGFGSSIGLPKTLLQEKMIRKGAPAITEAALIQSVIDRLDLKNFILLGMGSSNPMCYRLSKLHPHMALAIFSNAMFNQDIWDVFRPRWFQTVLKQAITSRSAMKLGIHGVKYQLRKSPLSFYQSVLQKSQGDQKYLDANTLDFLKAGALIRKIDASTINYDIKTSMLANPSLRDDFFEGRNCVVLTGVEADEVWKTGLAAEAERLSLPISYAPEGDFFAPYVSVEHLISLIKEFG